LSEGNSKNSTHPPKKKKERKLKFDHKLKHKQEVISSEHGTICSMIQEESSFAEASGNSVQLPPTCFFLQIFQCI